MNIKPMDIVARVSYNCDILFRVIDIREEGGKVMAILYGEEYRLAADAPCEDLIRMEGSARRRLAEEDRSRAEQSLFLFRQDVELLKHRQEYEATEGYTNSLNHFQMPGRVLHLDGDPNYLKKCLQLYERVGVPVYGVHCNEKEMPLKIGALIDFYRPDILVITGHDAYSKTKGPIDELNAYRHSRHFIQAVQEARKKVPNLDQLVIFAGACQSHFESLIRAGANFASSPLRVNIHALDPVYIVAKVSLTPFVERIHVWDVLRNTLTGDKGLGGIETKGVLRMGMPYHKKND